MKYVCGMGMPRKNVYFAREEMDMIEKEYKEVAYGEHSLEMSRYFARRKYEQEREALENEIKGIMEKSNVPRWKAELYYYYSSDTTKFLYFREERQKRNLKNKIKRYFNEDLEAENITTIDWKELYEILGSLPYFRDILKVITKILYHIEFLYEKKEILPYIFDEEIVWSVARLTPNFSIQEDLGEDMPIIEEAIKRYLLTELPEGSVFSLNFFEKLNSTLKRVVDASGGFTHDFVEEYEHRKILCVKTEFSYFNKK